MAERNPFPAPTGSKWSCGIVRNDRFLLYVIETSWRRFATWCLFCSTRECLLPVLLMWNWLFSPLKNDVWLASCMLLSSFHLSNFHRTLTKLEQGNAVQLCSFVQRSSRDSIHVKPFRQFLKINKWFSFISHDMIRRLMTNFFPFPTFWFSNFLKNPKPKPQPLPSSLNPTP